MARLSGSERKYLRGVAHSYKPLVQIGKEGLNDNVLGAVDTAIEAHELIKVKLAADRNERERLVPIIKAKANCECVGTVGRIAILYRRNPDSEKRKITLP